MVPGLQVFNSFTHLDDPARTFTTDDEVARIDWSRSAAEIARLVRGCDPSPGARADLAGTTVRLFGSRLTGRAASEPAGTLLGTEDGRLLISAEGGVLAVKLRRAGIDVQKIDMLGTGLQRHQAERS